MMSRLERLKFLDVDICIDSLAGYCTHLPTFDPIVEELQMGRGDLLNFIVSRVKPSNMIGQAINVRTGGKGLLPLNKTRLLPILVDYPTYPGSK